MALCVFIWSFGIFPALAGAPTNELKGLIDRGIAVIEDDKLDDAAKAERLRELTEPYFDFPHISRLVLGQQLRANPGREEEFTLLFKKLLERRFINRLLFREGKGARVIYVSERIEEGIATVELKIIKANGEENSLIFRMHRAGNRWKIYDIRTIGISLVSTYRTQFSVKLQKISFDELLAELRNKVESPDAAENRR